MWGGIVREHQCPALLLNVSAVFGLEKVLGSNPMGHGVPCRDFRMRIFSRCGIVMFMTFSCRNFRSYLIVKYHINKITNILLPLLPQFLMTLWTSSIPKRPSDLEGFLGSTNLPLTYEKASYGFNYSYLPPARYEFPKALNVYVVSMVSTACHHWIRSKFIGLWRKTCKKTEFQ